MTDDRQEPRDVAFCQITLAHNGGSSLHLC